MYTLVSAGVLALDLSRHPAGARLADLVDAVLTLDDHTVQALAVAAADPADRRPARRRLLDLAAAEPTAADGLAAVTAGLRSSSPRLPASTALGSRLLGRLPHLHALLVQEGPLAHADVDVAATGAALDAVTATWCAPCPDAVLEDLAVLVAPWRAAVPPFPAPLPTAVPDGASAALLDLLDLLAGCTPAQWTALDEAHDASYDGLGWSDAVHAACALSAETDRTFDVARWLLATARTAGTTGHPTDLVAPGAMMSVVAAVQATCVRDLLPEQDVATMTGPCRAVLGWRG